MGLRKLLAAALERLTRPIRVVDYMTPEQRAALARGETVDASDAFRRAFVVANVELGPGMVGAWIITQGTPGSSITGNTITGSPSGFRLAA